MPGVPSGALVAAALGLVVACSEPPDLGDLCHPLLPSCADNDFDGDGVPNGQDPFPFDASCASTTPADCCGAVCAAGWMCGGDGTCFDPCDGLSCGPGSHDVNCGTCAAGALCVKGNCCAPQCAQERCGDDGCGGTCPHKCEAPLACEGGTCELPKNACGGNKILTASPGEACGECNTGHWKCTAQGDLECEGVRFDKRNICGGCSDLAVGYSNERQRAICDKCAGSLTCADEEQVTCELSVGEGTCAHPIALSGSGYPVEVQTKGSTGCMPATRLLVAGQYCVHNAATVVYSLYVSSGRWGFSLKHDASYKAIAAMSVHSGACPDGKEYGAKLLGCRNSKLNAGSSSMLSTCLDFPTSRAIWISVYGSATEAVSYTLSIVQQVSSGSGSSGSCQKVSY